jgi:dolichyl-phosphate beta-glucosyltransferase
MPSSSNRFSRRSGIELSLILPAFNEEKRLPRMLQEAIGYLQREYPGAYEILVVDDGSSDRTSEVAAKLIGRSNVLSQDRNRGKGAAVRCGMLAASGRRCLFADADGATPIGEEKRLRQAMDSGADLVIGSRASETQLKIDWRRPDTGTLKLSQDRTTVHALPHRFLLGRTFSLLVHTLLGLSFKDTQCGFKMFRDEAARALFSQTVVDGFAFDVEVIYLACSLGLRVVEVPVNWHDVQGGKVRLAIDPWRMLWDIARIRARRRSGTEQETGPRRAA